MGNIRQQHEIEIELHLICVIRAFKEPIYAATSAKARIRRLSQPELEELRNALHRQFNVINQWIADVEKEKTD